MAVHVELLPTSINTGFPVAFSPTIIHADLDGGTTFASAETYVIGSLLISEFGANISDCFFEAVTATTLPQDADPPFPPVWPYLFSTDVIYGRDHLNVQLKMVRLDDYEFDIVCLLNGSAVNLTNCSLKMTVKWSPTDADASAIFQLTSSPGGGITITDAVAGEAHVLIASSRTTALPLHTVYLPFDIQLIDSTSKIRTLTVGTLTVIPDLTQATS